MNISEASTARSIRAPGENVAGDLAGPRYEASMFTA
jgi:hypothetical protein